MTGRAFTSAVDELAGTLSGMLRRLASLERSEGRAARVTPWINLTFSTGWTNLAAGYQTCQYRKVGDLVTMRGLAMINTALGTPTASVTTLPAGYRPTLNLATVASAGEPNMAARLDITSTGVVAAVYQMQAPGSGTQVAFPLTNNNWVSLNNVSFSVS